MDTLNRPTPATCTAAGCSVRTGHVCDAMTAAESLDEHAQRHLVAGYHDGRAYYTMDALMAARAGSKTRNPAPEPR